MVTVVVLSSFIPAIGKSSATNQIDWNGCCFTENSNQCAGLTKQPLPRKLPEYSLPLTSTKSHKQTQFIQRNKSRSISRSNQFSVIDRAAGNLTFTRLPKHPARRQ
jgi:Golgi nucleoside diphosphatase